MESEVEDRGVRFKVFVLGPAREGEARPAMMLEGRFGDAADARKFAIERIIEAWGEAAVETSTYEITPLD